MPARPQSTRAPGCGVMAPLIVSSVSAPSTVHAERLQRADHQVGVAAAQRTAEGRRPCGVASAASTSARLVCDFEPGTVTVACTGVGVDGACQVLTASILPCRASRATMGYMCGRFAVTTDPALLAEKIQAIDESTASAAATTKDATDGANYNVAPTTTISTVVKRHNEPDDESTRRVRSMRWGLVPPWAKTAEDGGPDTKGPLLINARSEKVTSSPAFRNSAKSKRCLVPMDGWYEWRPNGELGVGQEGAEDAVLHVRRRRRDAVHGGAVVDVAARKELRPRTPAVAELHDHHHRRRGTARRDPRPDAADDQPRATGTAGSTPTLRSTKACCVATATSTASRSARCRGWSTAFATTAPS